ncbi:uroporphyrinogen-III synthase [Thiothrix nivea]|uniref:Uroporphyrinogen-III synthase n=1 Tax=Thiothrix nivea (strain ATCC 35100 / DSM 5205 / JP2) TaxID=870187 RepID=A0A656HDH8_THINJ|nr:uroporphyrinogen-III synthase [Thiothrix nivea]EIJ34938.1 Uroporphyrinogen III synthase HEM4 [Thiothrix nivea DSM 5205]
MPETLRGLNVVVTRPAHQAARFQQMLEQAGANAVLFPVIVIAPPEQPALAQTMLASLDSYDAAIFISANAVRFGLEQLDENQRQTLRKLTLGAVGKQTAGVLQQHGFGVQLVPASGYTSEDFLALPAVQRLVGKRILIFRGAGGREWLADALRSRGASVDYVEVYRRICPEIDTSGLKLRHERQQLDIIAITSSEGLLNLLAMLDNPDWIKTVPLLAGSQRMVEAARQAGFSGTIAIADNPGDEAMLQALTHWAQESRQ